MLEIVKKLNRNQRAIKIEIKNIGNIRTPRMS